MTEPKPKPERIVAPDAPIATVPLSFCRGCKKVGTRVVHTFHSLDGMGRPFDYCGFCGRTWPMEA